MDVCDLQVFVYFRGERVLYVGVAAWICHFEGQGELFAVENLFDMIQELLELLKVLGLVDFPQWLVEF